MKTRSDNTPPLLPRPPRRVVSLVPSTTESLFELGLGETLVGITDYCTDPPEAVARLPRLGGPKNPRVAEILALRPDLVLANWEENTGATVAQLEAAGVPVWVSFPKSAVEALAFLWGLAGLYRSPAAGLRVRSLQAALDWARAAAAGRPPVRYFCPVWYDRTLAGSPWLMTFNRQTYCDDLLSVLGGENVFSGRQRRFPLAADLGQAPAEDPGERDTRYPRVSAAEVLAADPALILLPSEPFNFDEGHRLEIGELFAGTRAVREGRLFRVDGRLITWHGTRLGRALQELPRFFESD